MNCDDAFERLTSPEYASDADLQSHLNGCRRCRAMRETLSPAMDWLSAGDVPLDQTRESHGRRSVFLTDEAVRVAERAAHRLAPPAPAAPRPRRMRNRSTRWTALAAIAAVCCFAIFVFPAQHESRTAMRTTASPPAPANCLWLMRERGGPARPTAEEVVSSCMACHFSLP